MKPINAIAVIFLFVAGIVAGIASASGGAPVRVFDAGELTPDRYTVLERIWTGTWRTLFWIPGHDDAGAAVAAAPAPG